MNFRNARVVGYKFAADGSVESIEFITEKGIQFVQKGYACTAVLTHCTKNLALLQLDNLDANNAR